MKVYWYACRYVLFSSFLASLINSFSISAKLGVFWAMFGSELAEVGVFGGTSISPIDDVDCIEKSKLSFGDIFSAKLARLVKIGVFEET